MKREEFLKLCLVSATTASGLSIAPAVGAAETQPAIPATAKLLEVPGKMPPDDLYDYAFVMKYEVTGGGKLDKQTILVAHYKPRQPRAKIKDKMKPFVAGTVRSFNVGDVHKLELAADLKMIWKGPLVDEYAAADRKSVRYWCLKADPA
jgi:hypothetical protein